MSSGKLDKSLDEILSSQRRTAGSKGYRNRRSSGRPAPQAPAGGIQKATRATRSTTAKTQPAKGRGATGKSKIVVSNMPKDVSEKQIKDYFEQDIGPVHKVEINYGPNQVSRGIATVIFSHADGATKAFQRLNGLLIDNRPVKVEVVVSSADQIPQPAALSDRVSQPKNAAKAQPKSAAADKSAAGPKGGKKNAPRRGRNARPAKKTAEELDSEMADYFENNNAQANPDAANSAAPAAAAADAPMEDEIL